MIPLSLVTGFLGAGKTTFLRRTARRFADWRIVYLVNEFSSVDVDGRLLRALGPGVVSIPGGSIFCRCLVGEFIGRLMEMPRRFAGVTGSDPERHRGSDPGRADSAAAIEGVIVEASGIADPKVVADMLAETKLDRVYRLASIVTIVDPGSFAKLLVTLPNIRAQVEAADVVLLNKIDLFDEAAVAATAKAVREIRPAARIVRTVRCEAEVDLLGAGTARELHGEYAACVDPRYARFGVALAGPIDPSRLQAALEAVRDDLYRAKGFVPTATGLVYLDWSLAGVCVDPVAGPPAGAAPEPGLAIVARGERPEGVRRLVADLQAGCFAAGP